MTELGTGLGMLGVDSIASAIERRPATMASVSPETWGQLERAYTGGALRPEFERAWENGAAFLEAREGLRGRIPISVEWKGSQRAPGDEVAPVDLRIDHVFLVSCKYLSQITINASPFNLFDRLLEGGQGVRGADWFFHIAAAEYQGLYNGVKRELSHLSLPHSVDELRREDRKLLSSALAGQWPSGLKAEVAMFVQAVSRATAEHWRRRITKTRDAESLLWRMLRIGSAPYFVLGAAAMESIRLRVATPWDWRLDYRLKDFEVGAQEGGQPRVGWWALIEDRHAGVSVAVEGHVEVRWAHGRFGGYPEAKVYLDTPHARVPGYYVLV